MQSIFITGMFRSGTTLIGRMINAHNEISIASDGVFPFFKSLRTSISKKTGVLMKNEFDVPLHDYYFDRLQGNLYQSIQQSDLNVNITANELHELKEHIKFWCTDNDQYAPKLRPFVDELKGGTFSEIFTGILEIIEKAYASGGTKVIGPKEVWVGEFIPALSRSFQNMKFIYIIRDPRAVFASKKNRTEKYPWLFLARQWRKLATLGCIYSNRGSAFQDKILLLFFEDVITRPEETTRRICDFLKVEWNSDMVCPEKYIDGRGNPWAQNTAYGINGKNAFDTGTLGRWESVLSDTEIRLIEYLCRPEMEVLGYPLKSNLGHFTAKEIIFALPLVQETELAQWIRKHEDTSLEHLIIELEKEQLRYDLLNYNDKLDTEKYKLMLELCFLDQYMFEFIKSKKVMEN